MNMELTRGQAAKVQQANAYLYNVAHGRVVEPPMKDAATGYSIIFPGAFTTSTIDLRRGDDGTWRPVAAEYSKELS